MRYFVFDNQRKDTNYHELYKGKWDEKTFWKYDSIFLHDDFMFLYFEEAIAEIIPTYDPFGETVISKEEWKEIGKIITTKSIESKEIYNEASVWLDEVFQNYNCFTILGI